MAWVLDEASRDFLGNEFFAVALVLFGDARRRDQAVGRLGRDRHDGANPDARVSARPGPDSKPSATKGQPACRKRVEPSNPAKMPRKVGLTLVRHSLQYEFMLHAETLGIGSARLPPSEEEDERARLNETSHADSQT